MTFFLTGIRKIIGTAIRTNQSFIFWHRKLNYQSYIFWHSRNRAHHKWIHALNWQSFIETQNLLHCCEEIDWEYVPTNLFLSSYQPQLIRVSINVLHDPTLPNRCHDFCDHVFRVFWIYRVHFCCIFRFCFGIDSIPGLQVQETARNLSNHVDRRYISYIFYFFILWLAKNRNSLPLGTPHSKTY